MYMFVFNINIIYNKIVNYIINIHSKEYNIYTK